MRGDISKVTPGLSERVGSTVDRAPYGVLHTEYTEYMDVPTSRTVDSWAARRPVHPVPLRPVSFDGRGDL